MTEKKSDIFFKKSLWKRLFRINLHSQSQRSNRQLNNDNAIVPWCNGSTSVFGTASQGSSPCGITKKTSLKYNIVKYSTREVFFISITQTKKRPKMLKSSLNLVLGAALMIVFISTLPEFISDFNEYMRIINNVTVELEIHTFFITKLAFKLIMLTIAVLCLKTAYVGIKKHGLGKIKLAR